MVLRHAVPGVVLTLLVAAAAQAAPFEKGVREVQFAGSLEHNSVAGEGATFLNLSGFYGYCTNSHWEFGPVVVLRTTSAGGETFTTIGLTGDAYYNFTTGQDKTIPFVFAGLGFLHNSGGGSSLTTGILPRLGGGVRWLIGSSASINVDAFFEHDRASTEGVTESGNDLGVEAGFSIYPRGHGGVGRGMK